MTSAKPALLIVHGGYFLPSIWQPFMDEAAALGFEVRCPHQPTSGDSRPPKATLADDVAVVQANARELKTAGHPIIILAHSYGGFVATEAVTPDLYASEPRNSNTPGVVRIIYLAAHLPLLGGGIGDIFEKHGFLCDVDLNVNEDGTAYIKNAPASFYNDLPGDTAEAFAAKNVTHNFTMAVGGKITNTPPWKEIQCTYVCCDQDLAIKKPLQDAMIQDVKDAGGHLETELLHAAHNPFLSAPNEVLKVVQKVWSEAK